MRSCVASILLRALQPRQRLLKYSSKRWVDSQRPQQKQDPSIPHALGSQYALLTKLHGNDVCPAYAGYRLINGEGDLLPGLVCDVYGNTAVMKLDGEGPAGFYDTAGIAEWLQQQLPLEAVFLKNK